MGYGIVQGEVRDWQKKKKKKRTKQKEIISAKVQNETWENLKRILERDL